MLSLRSATGHLFVAAGIAPSNLGNYSMFGRGKVNADLGASIQLFSSISYNSGDGTATALYWDATVNDMRMLSLSAGVPIAGGDATLSSRPAIGQDILWFLDSNRIITRAGWAPTSDPSQITMATMTALNAEISTLNAIELTSNSNPCSSDMPLWRMSNQPWDPAVYFTDLLHPVSRIAGVFDGQLVDATTWIDHRRSGNASFVSQGGTLSTGDQFDFAPQPRTSRRNVLRPQIFQPGIAR